MRYTYADIGSLEVNLALTIDEMEKLSEFMSEANASDQNWVVRKFHRVLTESLNNTAELMRIHAKQMQEKPNA
jgi:hypothetical protein